MKISIIIVAHNEEEGLASLLDQLHADGLDKEHEVIVVNDGSTDATPAVASRYPVTLISHPACKGYGASLKTGIRRAHGDKVIALDGDGEHSSRDIPLIAEKLKTAEMVIGERPRNALRGRNSMLGRWLVKLLGEFLVEQKLPDFNSGFRGFDRKLILKMLHIMPNGFSFSTTSTCAFLREGYTVETVPIELQPRRGRKSSVRLFRDGAKTLLLMLRLTMLFNPLKIFFPASLLFWGAGMAYGMYTVITAQQLVKSALAVIFFGIILFFFGLVADQLAMLNRKAYVSDALTDG